jgi:hypothetical protein
MAERGLRVMAIAIRELQGQDIPESADATEVDLTLLGLIGIEDPPRPGVADSIARMPGCRHPCGDGDWRSSRHRTGHCPRSRVVEV